MRRRDVVWMLEQQERVVRDTLEAVSETVARTVASVLEVTLGPTSAEVDPGVDWVAKAGADAVGVAKMLGAQPGDLPAWGEAEFDADEDPDPTDLDKPFDSYETWDFDEQLARDLDAPIWGQPSTSRSAFLRPGESPIPSAPE